uniref:Tubulin gamma chain n=1 Tax=Heterorhabditis bacteriophora TaxID=37862 RepID=A0A1I7W9Q7_HETBA
MLEGLVYRIIHTIWFEYIMCVCQSAVPSSSPIICIYIIHSSDDDSFSIGSAASDEFIDNEGDVLILDFDATTNMRKQFVNLGGKFKLVIFTDLATQFARDTTLAFARATAIAHISSGPFSKMISTDNVTREACGQDDVNISPQLETIVLHALSLAIPVVPLMSIVVNFASVFAYYIHPKLVIKHNWDGFAAAHWDCNSDLLKLAKNPSIDVSSLGSVADLWVKIISEVDYVKFFQEKMSWKLNTIEEEFARKTEKVADVWQQKKANRARQYMSRWLVTVNCT